LKYATATFVLLAALLCLTGASALGGQQAEGALLRTFKPGEVQRYRVELTIHTEFDGHRAKRVGEQTYAEPVSRTSSGTISWRATRTILRAESDGTAYIEETLDEFSQVPYNRRSVSAGVVVALIVDDFSLALSEWIEGRTLSLRYFEAANGRISALGSEGAPVLDEAPAVLTLWLRRALRPSVAQPNRAPREGERWSEPRAVRLPPWTDVQGTESGEWLAGPSQDSLGRLINLHTVQQISGSIPSPAKEGSAEVPPGSARFHAESLSAVVHAGAPAHGGYGSLVSATRSASREVTHVVPGIPNMKEALFRARISVEVRIQLLE